MGNIRDLIESVKSYENETEEAEEIENIADDICEGGSGNYLGVSCPYYAHNRELWYYIAFAEIRQRLDDITENHKPNAYFSLEAVQMRAKINNLAMDMDISMGFL